MTTGTGSLCLRVIKGTLRYGNPLRSTLMTDIASIGRGHVGRALTTGHHTIVATDTTTNHLLVINRRGRNRYPRVGGSVTSFARIARLDMAKALTRRDNTVVARDTSTDDLYVIHRDQRYPATALKMAGVTIITRCNMCIRFTNGQHIIVTTAALALNFVVVDIDREHRKPWYQTRFMAGLACIGGIDMGVTFTGSNGVVVTTKARACDFVVVNSSGLHGCPGRTYRMAGITSIRR